MTAVAYAAADPARAALAEAAVEAFPPPSWVERCELALAQAVADEDAVAFDYPSRDGTIKSRMFSPWELDEHSVIGWDHREDHIARFRYDRMQTLPISLWAGAWPAWVGPEDAD